MLSLMMWIFQLSENESHTSLQVPGLITKQPRRPQAVLEAGTISPV